MQKHKACMRSRLLQENGPDVALPCFAVIDVTPPQPNLVHRDTAGRHVCEGARHWNALLCKSHIEAWHVALLAAAMRRRDMRALLLLCSCSRP